MRVSGLQGVRSDRLIVQALKFLYSMYTVKFKETGVHNDSREVLLE